MDFVERDLCSKDVYTRRRDDGVRRENAVRSGGFHVQDGTEMGQGDKEPRVGDLVPSDWILTILFDMHGELSAEGFSNHGVTPKESEQKGDLGSFETELFVVKANSAFAWRLLKPLKTHQGTILPEKRIPRSLNVPEVST